MISKALPIQQDRIIEVVDILDTTGVKAGLVDTIRRDHCAE